MLKSEVPLHFKNLINIRLTHGSELTSCYPRRKDMSL